MQHTLDLTQADINQSTADIDRVQYAIVEPLLCPDIMTWIYEGDTPAEFIPLFTGTRYESLTEQGPLLIALSHRSSLKNNIKAVFERSPVGCFIQSDLDITSFGGMLCECLTINEGSNPALFRYYEPRMLLPLMMVMTEMEKQHFFQGLQSFIWFDKVWLTAAINHTPLQDAKVSQWQMNPQHCDAMERARTQWQQTHLASTDLG